ncbi:PREDICTED: something about silencing protein 10-like isoform X2 [Branchiostoma belcheri]|uniref:Something about silencing protein 10-like isoform X1 n=1 Tax=Branchiostoma belcheri TaxID=7741 RepID=A0A6P4YFM4_BRABE|nr:PREDICTED: something about silencing protein 10-like isoform X1 [Branchiostoma belcheri]XP_019628036.1 PREDICTED: something about silencing protein 10-like isoform X2 [Branchiostoma belcheri]
MARGKRKRSKRPVAKATENDSDASDAQNDQLEPDDYLNDDVDDFYSQKDKVLLDAARDLEPADSSEDEEEVMALDVPDSDDDEEEEDEEEEDDDEMADSDMGEQDDDMPDEKAWGQKKSLYYNTDYVDEDLPGVVGDEEEEEAQQEEEREALAIQKRMAEALSEEDFGLELFKPAKKPTKDAALPEEEAEERVLQDLSQLSHRERMDLLRKEAPELKELMDDFKEKLQEVIDRLHPLLKMVRSGVIPPGKGATYVETKFQLYLNYCVNISFYLVLKAGHTPNVRSHPVINRLVQYRNLINELAPLDEELEGEVLFLLGQGTGEAVPGVVQKIRRKHTGKHKPADTQDNMADLVQEDTQDTQQKTKLKKRKKEHLTAAEKEAIEFYEQMKAKRRKAQLEEEESSEEEREDTVAEEKPAGDHEEEEEEGEDGKRAITYEISKNKGLTPKRKKEERNPRVKLRKKFRRAKIRRKGQVREHRTELHRYDGEFSGIKAGVKKSTRLIT